jgi:beta-galactosidase GanA
MSTIPSFNNQFPIGTHVFREPCLDLEPVLADLPLLKRAGFNLIKIQEHWSHDEPRPGEYDLERVERLVARAGELGLGVYLGLTMEQAPAWLYREHPDCFLVYANGVPHNDPTQYCLPTDGKPGPCWDHPGARTAAAAFIRALAARLGRYENIWCWNTWQEIGFWHNDGGALGFCYCPHTLAAFRAWLGERYSTLGALNAAWRTAYGEWDEVQPPRRNAFNPPFVDWRYFMDDVYLARALTFKTQALREGDPLGRPVFSHLASPTIGSGAEWRWARVGDFFGTSNYPAWYSHHHWDDGATAPKDQHECAALEMWQAFMLRGDYVRSATGRGRAFWGAEFQGGPVSTHLHMGRVPDAADIRRWMLSGLAAGMHAISFWNHRAEVSWQECNGFGLLDARGDTSERFEEVARIGRALQRHAALFTQGEPPQAQVALIVNQDLWHWAQGTQNQAADLLSYNLRGHYARLWRLGIAVDFIEAEQVADGALAGYRATLLPFPLALDPAFFQHLVAYVEQGGTLLSEACPGRFDRLGFCPRAELVDGGEELFGARHRRVQLVREPGGATRWSPPERTWGEYAPPTVLEGTGSLAGEALRANFYLQTLEPTTGDPILLAGDACAGVRNQVGSGTAVLLGTYAGLGATAHVDSAGDKLFARVLGDAGVTPDTCGRLLRRRRVYGSQQAWFLINPHPEEIIATVALDGFSIVGDLLGDAVTAHGDADFTVRVAAGSVCCVVVE